MGGARGAAHPTAAASPAAAAIRAAAAPRPVGDEVTMRLRLAVGAIMALLVAGVPATAAELPAPTSHVVDIPDAMDSTMRWATEQQLENFETKSGIHVAV